MPTRKNNKIEIEEMLVLMRAVNEKPQITQRDLSFSLGLSLGKINYLIRAMIGKGYIKAENFRNSKNKMAYLYYLTPSGVEKKAKITYHFLKRKMVEYGKLEEEIKHLKKEVGLLDISVAARGKI